MTILLNKISRLCRLAVQSSRRGAFSFLSDRVKYCDRIKSFMPKPSVPKKWRLFDSLCALCALCEMMIGLTFSFERAGASRGNWQPIV